MPGIQLGKWAAANVPPAQKPGDDFPVASCAGCGSPFGTIAIVTQGDGGPLPITTSSDVKATSVTSRPELPFSPIPNTGARAWQAIPLRLQHP